MKGPAKMKSLSSSHARAIHQGLPLLDEVLRITAFEAAGLCILLPTPKPQIPVEEIDPDSFDRGTFARGSTPLANVGNHYGPANNSFGQRGQRNFNGPMQRGGGFRGHALRGRGRGRLFVP